MRITNGILRLLLAGAACAAPIAQAPAGGAQTTQRVVSTVSNGILYIVTIEEVVQTVTVPPSAAAATAAATVPASAAAGTTTAAAVVSSAASSGTASSGMASSGTGSLRDGGTTGAINPTSLIIALLPSPSSAASSAAGVETVEATTTIYVSAPTSTPSPSPPSPTTTTVVKPVTTTLSTAASPTVPATSAAAAVAPSAPATPSPAPATGGSKISTPLTPSLILKVATNAGSCANAPYPTECITSSAIAPAVAASYSTYGISSLAAQAAVLSLMTFESGGFIYDMKHFPPTPGQGTRNMMSPNFVAEYATALYGAGKVTGLDPAAVLALVQNDIDSCGSGAWFLATKCPGVLAQFATDPEGAWTAYHGSGCIGTELTDARTAIWTVAKAAFGGIA